VTEAEPEREGGRPLRMCIDFTAETVGQKLNTKNLVQLKVVGKLPRKDTPFRAQLMLRYAGRDSWEPVCICTDTA